MKTNVLRMASAGVLLLVGLLLGVGLHSATSQGLHVVPTNSEIGRYQLITAGTGGSPYIYFLDTKTGRLWLQDSPGGRWQRAASPMDANH